MPNQAPCTPASISPNPSRRHEMSRPLQLILLSREPSPARSYRTPAPASSTLSPRQQDDNNTQPINQKFGRIELSVQKPRSCGQAGGRASERAPPITAPSDCRCCQSIANVTVDLSCLLACQHSRPLRHPHSRSSEGHWKEAAERQPALSFEFLNGRAHRSRAANYNSAADSELNIIRDRGH